MQWEETMDKSINVSRRTARVYGIMGLAAALLLAGCGNDGGGTAKSPSASSGGTVIKAVSGATTGGYNWSNVNWGGGGYVSGITYHPSVQGLVYARTDVGGVYRRDPGSSTWIPLNDDLNRDDTQLMGVESIAVDPNNSQKLYAATGMYLPSWGRTAAILRSSDRGNTWSRTELPIRLGGNSDGRGTGERLQVDPHLGSVLFLGTNQDGLYKSTDSGVTWNKVTSFTPSATTFVVFERSKGTNGQATPSIWVGVATTTGPGLYHSSDGGATWAAVSSTQPSGLMPLSAQYDGWGNLFVTYGNALGPNGVTNGAVYKYVVSSNSFVNITPSAPNSSLQFGYGGVGVGVQNPNVIVVSTIDRWGSGDEIYRSTDGGGSWTALNAISSHAAPYNPWLTAYSGGSLAGKMGHWITDVDIDPYNNNNVMYNTGYGLWESNNAMAGSVAWSFNISGIEETAVNTIVSTPTGAHLMFTQGDVGGGRYDTDMTNNSGFFPNPAGNNYGIDFMQWWPSFVARTIGSGNTAQLSWDNGVTWSNVGSSPVTGGSDAGKIAVATGGGTLLWVPGGQGAYYSTNNGSSWTASSGYPTTGSLYSGAYYEPISDKSADGYFYTYNSGNGTILESSDSGKTFHNIYTGLDVLPTYAAHNKLISIPTQRRDLWLATPNGLWHINGSGAQPVKIANIQGAYGVGYGMAASGQSYPTLFISARINNVYGVYRSTDGGNSWTRINDDKHQYNLVDYVAGDPRVFGRVYIQAGGRGAVVGNPQ